MFSQNNTFNSASEIKTFQDVQLQKQLVYLKNNSPFYRQLFEKHAIEIEKITTLEDLNIIPTTSKEDIQLHGKDCVCVPETSISEYTTTSGTLGEPVVFPLTENDLNRLAYNEYLSFKQAEISHSDIILLTITSDRCFMAGLAYTLGARKVGAALIRTGPGLPEMQWNMIARLKPTVIIAVPSFLLKMIEFAEKKGIDFIKSSIQKAICVGESLRNEDLTPNVLAKKITTKWPIQLFSSYASTEMSTAFTECAHGKGGHLSPELLIVECLDENENPVQNSETGEITITTLGVEGVPLLRYKTGDIARLHYEPCTCGNPSLRIGPIIGRKKQMIKYKGTTFYPNAIKEVIESLEFIESYYSEVYTNEIGLDELIIHISLKQENFELEKKIKEAFQSKLRVIPILNFESKSEIDTVRSIANARKPIDFIDKRKKI
jgi:phenylacetate-CoA ligase